MSDLQGNAATGQQAPADAEELYGEWRGLVKSQRAADAKMLDVICHAEVIDEQILMVVHARRASYGQLRDMKPGLQKMLRLKGKFDLAASVEEDWARLHSPELPPLPGPHAARRP